MPGSAQRIAWSVPEPSGSGGRRGGISAGKMDGLVGAAGIDVAGLQGALQLGRRLTVADDEAAAIPSGLGLQRVVEEDEIGAAAAAQAAELAVQRVAGRGMKRAEAPRGLADAGRDGRPRGPPSPSRT